MKRSSNISKSVRLPEHLVMFIERQPGKDFTTKLSGLLDECLSGEKKRQENKLYYENLIKQRQEELRKYNDLVMTFGRLRRDVISIERILHDTFNSLEVNKDADS